MCSSPDSIANGRPLVGCRVLLADDAASMRHIYSTALARAGADVTTVADGAAAVQAWSAAREAGRPFGAVVLDYAMPELDGGAVAATLRAGGFQRPIIGISAELPESEQGKWLAVGCDEVLRKGISLTDLVGCVAAAVRPR